MGTESGPHVVGDDPDGEWDRVVRAHFVMDGAGTLGEAAEKLRRYAGELEAMERAGWRLVRPVKDHGFVTRRPLEGAGDPDDEGGATVPGGV